MRTEERSVARLIASRIDRCEALKVVIAFSSRPAPDGLDLVARVLQDLAAREASGPKEPERLLEVVFVPLDRFANGRGDRAGGQLLDLVAEGLLEVVRGLDPHRHVDALLRAEARRPEQVVVGEGVLRLGRRRAVDRHSLRDGLDGAGPEQRQGQQADGLEVPAERRLGEFVLKELAGRLLAVVRPFA